MYGYNERNRTAEKPTSVMTSSGRLTGSVVWWLGHLIRHLEMCVWFPAMTLPACLWDRWPSLVGKLSWDITTSQANSALHPWGVTKSSTSFGWGKSKSHHSRVLAVNTAASITVPTCWNTSPCVCSSQTLNSFWRHVNTHFLVLTVWSHVACDFP